MAHLASMGTSPDAHSMLSKAVGGGGLSLGSGRTGNHVGLAVSYVGHWLRYGRRGTKACDPHTPLHLVTSVSLQWVAGSHVCLQKPLLTTLRSEHVHPEPSIL